MIEEELHLWAIQIVKRHQCTQCMYILGRGDYDEYCYKTSGPHTWDVETGIFHKCQKCGVMVYATTKPPRAAKVGPHDVRNEMKVPKDYKSYKTLNCAEFLLLTLHEEPWPLVDTTA